VFTFLGDLGTGAPTRAELVEGATLQREGATALARYRAFVTTEVLPLDAALRTAGRPPIDLRATPPPTKPDPNADEHARRAEDDD